MAAIASSLWINCPAYGMERVAIMVSISWRNATTGRRGRRLAEALTEEIADVVAAGGAVSSESSDHIERLNHEAIAVLSLRETAAMIGISYVSLRRLIAQGDGPRVTNLSARRRGVRLRHALEWLDNRVEPISAKARALSRDR
jgi:hypothetical protein